MKLVGGYIIFLLIFLGASYNDYSSTNPTWVTSPFFRAGNEAVIKTKTGNDQTPMYTFTFSSPLPGIPNLAYGIKEYRGNDLLIQELFQIRRRDLTAATFRVSIQIYGFTNVHILNVPYIAVDPTFPHHLNSFDNVPVNYANGALTHINVKSDSKTTYTNQVNYTAQSSGRSYTRFRSPLENNRILLFITRIEIWAGYQYGGVKTPIELEVFYQVISEQAYEMKVTMYHKTRIDGIHFSQIMFDVADVQSSNKYFIVFELWIVETEGGFKQIPRQFTDNFIMGLTDFHSSDGWCGFQYRWIYSTSNGKLGVQVLDSVTINNVCGFNLMKSTVFYMKTWECVSPYIYFNLTSNKCQDKCGDYHYQISSTQSCDRCKHGCQDCSTSTDCLQCNYQKDHRRMSTNGECQCTDNYFDDGVNEQCVTCTSKLSNCTKCTYVSSSSIKHQCLQCNSQYFLNSSLKSCVDYVTCDASQNYFLNKTVNHCQQCTIMGCKTCESLQQCQLCDEDSNYFMNFTSLKCQFCSITGCKTCQRLTRCKICDENNNYFMNSSILECQTCQQIGCTTCKTLTTCNTCNPLENYFINSTTQICQTCVQAGCITCKTLTTCKICNQSDRYFINNTNTICQLCSLTGCTTCKTLYTCNQCTQSRRYFINSTSQLCQTCVQVGCITCETLTTCKICNQSDRYFINNTNTICQVCSLTGCTTCKTLYTCNQCTQSRRYFINSTSQLCQTCVQVGCITCETLTTCKICNQSDRYFINNTNTICQVCSLTGCTTCKTLYTCKQCNEAQAYFINNTNQHCNLCNKVGCTTCDTLYKCKYCTESNNYFMNITSEECETCHITGCTTCKTLYKCLHCTQPDNYFMNISSEECEICNQQGCITCKTLYTCKTCNESGNYFINQTSIICQTCVLQGCSTCQKLTECKICNITEGYFLNITKLCVDCSVGCLLCDTLQAKCNRCGAGFYLENGVCKCLPNTYFNSRTISCKACDDKCQNCSGPTLYECLSCYQSQNRVKRGNKCICDRTNNYKESDSNSLVCERINSQACDSGYVYMKVEQKCMPVCGNGLVQLGEECDDANYENKDGCSIDCKVETDYRCENETDQKSYCVFIGELIITKVITLKNPYGNHLLMDLTVYPYMTFFQIVDWKTGLKILGPNMTVNDAWMNDRVLVVNTTYFEDLRGKFMTIKCDTAATISRRLFTSALQFHFTVRDYELPILPSNNLEPALFSDSTYEQAKLGQDICIIGFFIILAILIALLIIKSSLPTMQIIVVLQLLFLSLSSLTELHPIQLALTEFSQIKGLRYKQIFFDGFVAPNQELGYNVQVLGYVTSLFGNMNLMFFIQFLIILISVTLYLMSAKDISLRNAFKVAQRQLLLMIIFNMLNLCFSLGLMSSIYPFQITLAIVSVSMLIYQIIHFCRNIHTYFKSDLIFNLRYSKTTVFIIAFVFGKCFIALLLSTLRNHTTASVITIVSIQALLVILFTVLRAYKETLFNVTTLMSEYLCFLYLAINACMKFDAFKHGDSEDAICWVQIAISIVVICLAIVNFFYSIYIDFIQKKKIISQVNIDEDQVSEKNSQNKNSGQKFQNTMNQSNDKFSISNIEDEQFNSTNIQSSMYNLDSLSPSRRKF